MKQSSFHVVFFWRFFALARLMNCLRQFYQIFKRNNLMSFHFLMTARRPFFTQQDCASTLHWKHTAGVAIKRCVFVWAQINVINCFYHRDKKQKSSPNCLILPSTSWTAAILDAGEWALMRSVIHVGYQVSHGDLRASPAPHCPHQTACGTKWGKKIHPRHVSPPTRHKTAKTLRLAVLSDCVTCCESWGISKTSFVKSPVNAQSDRGVLEAHCHRRDKI